MPFTVHQLLPAILFVIIAPLVNRLTSVRFISVMMCVPCVISVPMSMHDQLRSFCYVLLVYQLVPFELNVWPNKIYINALLVLFEVNV